jgi:hypothetical protein
MGRGTELLEKLAALTPRPRINLVLYHGVLAPHSGWRARVVVDGVPPVEAPVPASASPEANDEPTTALVCRHWAWADLTRRVFDIDVLACPRCGGRLRLIAPVEDPDAIRAILVAGTRSRELADRAPPFAPALTPATLRQSGSERLRTPPSPKPVRSCRGRGSLLWARCSVAQQKSLDRPIVRAIPGGGTREPAAAVVRSCGRAGMPTTAVPSTGPLSRLCSPVLRGSWRPRPVRRSSESRNRPAPKKVGPSDEYS